ncbi:hypothetical protein BCR35DRAFT_354596 [Leucosporidium creatinivorum]|uniref:SH3 domain-containing protein n=1 Tax=Leucosporidium creatinivorum TaxID=106004 RepID=A0A1Y2EDN7_9BASI|nr:hypothetical protein BCR35DRAFT_354596 [Leucosporidium creatinivorum]
MTTPSTGRRSSSSSSRHRSSSSGGGIGTWAPELAHTEADFDFCNAYWVTPPNARQRSSSGREGEEEDWGRGGVETVLGRMRMGSKGLEELRGFYRERAVMEEDYSKKLNKLSRHGFGAGETGHLDRAILQTKGECDAMAKAHTDLANLMRTQETQVNEFLNKREGARKSQQMNIEKKWKELNNCRHHVLKAKDKYEQDAIAINSLHASASLLQGRDLDKATMKLDKAQQTVVVNERDYKQYTSVLKESTATWNMAWKAFCDLCQDQEEERLEFVKGRLWDWANALSTVAMSEDESAERTRTALEQCEAQTDIKLFVSATGTGNSIPDPLPFVDFSKGGAPPKQGYKLARFTRSSTRMPGVKHSPSAVDDIARAFHQQPQQQQRAPTQPQQQAPPPQQQQQDPRARANSQGQRQSQQGVPPSASAQSLASAPRPQSRVANRPPSRGETLAAPTLSASPSSTSDLSPSQETTPTRPKMAESTSGRFAVSPSANLRGSSERVPSSSSASGIGLGKPGHISAGAFQRGSMSPSPSAVGMSGAEGRGTSPKPAPYEAPIPPQEAAPVKQAEATAPEDDENDPLAQALKKLQASASSPRTGGFAGPAPGAVGLPGMTNPAMEGGRPTHRQSQQSLGRAAGAGFGAPPPGGPGSTSRPTSPAPIAAMMQPPPSHPSSSSRPSSRQGSAPPQQQRYSNSQTGSQVGIGARGRSPSPQPFTHPEALRPHSPSPSANPARSSSPQPGGGASGFAGAGFGHQKQASLGAPNGYGGAAVGGRPQSQQLGGRAPSPGTGGHFARAPSPGPQQGYGRAPSPSPQVQQQQQYGRAPSPAPQAQQPYGRAPSPSPHQQYRAPSPTPQLQHHQQHPSVASSYAQAPSQHFQPPPSQLHHHPSQHFQPQHPVAGVASPASSVSAYATPSPSLVGMQSPYQQSAPSSVIGSPAPYQQQQPQPHQPFRHPSAAPPPSLAAPGPNGAPYNAAQIPTQQQMGVHRSPSMHSGASSAVSASQAYGGVQMQQPYQQQQQPQQQGQFQQHQQQQQYAQPQQQPAPAPAQSPAGPPTGQYTDEGKPILFYVNAIYDYAAASAEEFSFSLGDVIAVTDTDPDGWWKGNKVGVTGGGKLFPSNFTELLS